MRSSRLSWYRYTLVAGLLAVPAAAQQGARWSHGNGTLSWIGERASLGNLGTQVFTELGPAYPALLFSSFDANPPTPVWESASEILFHHSIASAEAEDVHVSLVQRDATATQRRAELRKFTSASPVPDWTAFLSTPINHHEYSTVRITPDGKTIVAGVFNMYTWRLDVYLFDAGSQVPTTTLALDTSGPFRAFRISDDARTLYTASDVVFRVFDLPSGALLTSEYPPGGNVFKSHALSGDGSIFAYGTYNGVRIFKRVGQGYALDFVHQLGGTNYCDALAISSDGSTMACAFNFPGSFARVDVQAVDLASRALTMSESVVGSGANPNFVTDLDVSAAGTRIALGLSGDGGAVHQLRIYDAHSSQPLQTHRLPGSVLDVDLSADGKRLAVASKGVHASTFGNGGRIELYDLAAFDVDVRGIPRAGATVDVQLRVGPGSDGNLFVAPAAAPDPVFYPGVGTYRLRRDLTTTYDLGVADATGRLRIGFPLPANGLGATLFLQGFDVRHDRLTDDWTKITVLP